MTISTIKIIKKTLALLTLYSLLNLFLTLNLYAHVHSLPTIKIKNGTPWTVKLQYKWTGCDELNKYKNEVSNAGGFDPNRYMHEEKIPSGKEFTFKKYCLDSDGKSVQITPYSLSGTFLNNLTLSIEGTNIVCAKTGCGCEGQFCNETDDSWVIPRDKVLVTLKYYSWQKNKANAYSGYYWDMDTNQ